MKSLITILLILALLLVVSTAAASNSALQGAAVWYVDHQASGENDGSSWTNAFNDLAEALDSAEGGAEVWVAAGLYTPANASSSFNLGTGIALYGASRHRR